MYSASGSSSFSSCCFCCSFDLAVVAEEEEVKEGNCSTTWPASQSRLSALSSPPQLFCTARVRAGQRLRERATDCSKRDWRVSIGSLVSRSG